MEVRGADKLSAYFNTGRQNTGIAILRTGDDSYEVKAAYRRTLEKGFPRHEVTRRDGLVDGGQVDALVDGLLRRCEGWYHHYLRAKHGQAEQLGSAETWWSLRIERPGGAISRWEGVGVAPWDIDQLYEELKGFGMPSLELGWQNSFYRQLDSHTYRRGLEMVEYYERLLGEVRGLGTEDEPSEDMDLVAREFVDDLSCWLEDECSGFTTRPPSKIWRIEPSLESLREADVHEAPRAQIYALYEALTRMDDPMLAVVALLDDGTLASWRHRLEKLPQKGYWDIRHSEKEAYEAEGAAVDKEVRKFIESGVVFTARDVAERIGCTGQRTSARIRAFVSRGELKVVQDVAPRRYQAA